jgi:hypothetical protein
MLMAGLMGLVGLVMVIAVSILISHFNSRDLSKRQIRK